MKDLCHQRLAEIAAMPRVEKPVDPAATEHKEAAKEVATPHVATSTTEQQPKGDEAGAAEQVWYWH